MPQRVQADSPVDAGSQRRLSTPLLNRRVGDWYVRRLAREEVEGRFLTSTEGTMQGGPLSPLLANILLDDFDKELELRGLHLVRYADDFLVFTRTSEAAHRVFRSIEHYLTHKLKLVINQQKSRVCKTAGLDFLGFAFEGYGGQIRVSPKNEQKFKDRIRELTRRNRGVSMTYRYSELRRYLQGWVGYFSLVSIKTYFAELDKWIRRRIRACYWKRLDHALARLSQRVAFRSAKGPVLSRSERRLWANA